MIVGMLGGGQLARMMAQAGQTLDIQTLFLDPATDACAGRYAEQLIGSYDDQQRLAVLAERADVITYEFENVPASSVEFLQAKLPVHPSTEALAIAQDRLFEKNLFQQLGVPVPVFHAVDNLDDLNTGIDQLGLPCVLKTRRMGYDGKGQFVIEDNAQAKTAWQAIGEVPAILEAMVPFDREVSMIAVRNMSGEFACYPLAENIHQQGVLRFSESKPDDVANEDAQVYIKKLMEHFNYVGVMALELFDVGGELSVNELAPRVHNSGHWTIEGAKTSQFENHLRAIAGMPLGSTEAVGYSTMVNCIGEMCGAEQDPCTYVHDYQKQSRDGRKVGHITIQCQDYEEMLQRVAQYKVDV